MCKDSPRRIVLLSVVVVQADTCIFLGYRNLGRPFSTWLYCCLIELLYTSSIFLSGTGKLMTPTQPVTAKLC